MLFKLSYHVSANTTTAAPNWKKLSICKGTIIGWVVFTPVKAADLLQLYVEYHGVQIFPFSGSEWFYGVHTPFLIPDDLLIEDAPFTLDIYAVNTDDMFDHEYNVGVAIEPVEPVSPTLTQTASWFERLRELFGGE